MGEEVAREVANIKDDMAAEERGRGVIEYTP